LRRAFLVWLLLVALLAFVFVTHGRGYRELLSSKCAFLELLKQFAAWLSHVFKARLPGPLRDKVDGIVSEVNPWEVEKMITNPEITLEEMQQQAEMRGLIKGRAEGEAIGKTRGKVEATQDAICKYLKRRFGPASDELQRVVRGVTSLEALDGVMEELFAANTLEEARAIIEEGINKSLQ